MQILPFRASALTFILMLVAVTLTQTSCGIKVPMDAQTSIATLANSLPVFMGKATGELTPVLAKEGEDILASITGTAKTLKGGKTDKMSNMLTSLAASKVKPFITMWKKKGKLDQKAIDTASKGVETAFAAIKKAGKLK
jgi:hypothetical protein